MDKTPADVLEEAADLLLIRGRCTFVGIDTEGRYCVLGAIGQVQGRDAEQWHVGSTGDSAIEALGRHMADKVRTSDKVARWYDGRAPWATPGDRWFDPARVVYFWNDVLPHPDDFEVIDTLRLVAKSLRNGEAS